MTRRQLTWIFAGTVLALIVIIIYQFVIVVKRGEPVRIGFIGTMTGKYAALGSTARDGAILAVEEINTAGGLDGRPIEMIYRDDEGDPSKAATHAQALADTGINYIIGPFLTVSGTAVLPVINRSKVLTISGTTMGQNLADHDDYYLVLIPTTGFYGQLLAETAIRKGFRKFGAISDSRNDPYCKTFIEGIKSGTGVGDSTTVNEVTFRTSSDVPYSEIVAPLALEDLDGVFLCASPFDTAMLAQNVKRISKDVVLFSTSWGISSELVQNGGLAVEGLYFFQSIDSTDPSENFLRFRDSFKDRFDRDPSYVAIFNYEAVQYLAQCLAQDPGASPEQVKELLLRKEGFKGVQSSFKLDGEGDVIRPLILHTVQAGTFVRVQ